MIKAIMVVVTMIMTLPTNKVEETTEQEKPKLQQESGNSFKNSPRDKKKKSKK